MREGVFESIVNLGSKDVPEKDKFELVLGVRGVLNDLGVDPKLVADVAGKIEPLVGLLGLVYGRKPDDSVKREGRGVYHKVSVAGREVTVYIKGIGNAGLVEDGEKRPFPGFPADTEKLIFDHIFSLSDHPRVLGTEALVECLLEFLNACVVFAEVARKRGWTRIEEALEVGMTVPIGVAHFKELSAYVRTLLERKIRETPYRLEAEQLKWEGNFYGLGSVGLIVPCDTRLPRLPDERLGAVGGLAELFARFKNSEMYAASGRTLRELLEIGVARNYSSSHGQNMYREGFGMADISDLVFLGDYCGDREVDDPFGGGRVRLSGREQRGAVVYMMLYRHDGLTPLAYPVPDFGVYWQDVEEAQKNFWVQFLGGVVHHEAVEKIPKLVPFLREQLILAVSVLVVERLESQQWDKIAAKRREVLEKYDKIAALVKSVEGEIDSDSFLYMAFLYGVMVSRRDVLGIEAMVRFLKTGNISWISSDEKLGPYFQLAEEIFRIEDAEVKDKLLYQVGRLQLERELSLVARGENLDTVDIFNECHIALMNKLVSSGRYGEAMKVAEAVRVVNRWRLSKCHPSSEVEYLSHYYAARLLEGAVDVNELYEQVKFFELLLAFQGHVTFDLISSTIMGEAVRKLDVAHYAHGKNVSNPKDILMSVIGRVVDIREERERLSDYMRSYESVFVKLLVAKTKAGEEEAVQALSLMAAKEGSRYPELIFAHNCTMVVYYVQRDRALAEEYYQKALGYYKDHYENRKEELGLKHDLWRRSDPGALGEIKKEKMRLFNKYSDLGFSKVAKIYARGYWLRS